MISKLVAGREKDYAFAGALLAVGTASATTLGSRLDMMDDIDPIAVSRVRQWLATLAN